MKCYFLTSKQSKQNLYNYIYVDFLSPSFSFTSSPSRCSSFSSACSFAPSTYSSVLFLLSHLLHPLLLLLTRVAVRSYLRLLGCWLRASCTVSRACCRCFWALSRRLSRWRECRSSPRRDSATCRGSMAAETYHTQKPFIWLLLGFFFRGFDIVEDCVVSLIFKT